MYGFESRPGHHMSWGNVAVGSARPRPMCTKCAQDVLAVRRRCADGGDAQHRRSEVAGLGEVLHGQGCRAGADSVPAARTHRCLPAPPDYAPTEVAFCAPIGRISCAPVRRIPGGQVGRDGERYRVPQQGRGAERRVADCRKPAPSLQQTRRDSLRISATRRWSRLRSRGVVHSSASSGVWSAGRVRTGA